MRFFLFAVLVLVSVADLQAGPPRRWRRVYQESACVNGSCSQVVATSTANVPLAPTASPQKATGQSCDDALAEVNAARAARGLKPYINDPVLNKAAKKCAARRASIHCDGHCPESDFTYLDPVYPVGSCVGGCAAWEPSWGWGACATYDNYTYCGAAWVMGSDGRRYMHLFVR